jgi:hypothetical protein
LLASRSPPRNAVHVYRLDELSDRAGRGHARAASNGLLTHDILRAPTKHRRRYAVSPVRRPKPDRRRALELFASCRDGCREAILLAHNFIIEHLQKRTTQFVLLFFGLPLFVFLVLALAQAGSGSSCHWAFPEWFGCVLATHENLAGGLIGLAGVLLGAWVAWSAVQQQINADRERAMADRVEADRLLSEALTDYADGMATAWRHLVALPEDADQDTAWNVYEATAYMAERLSRRELVANYRAMAATLGWDRRMSYDALHSWTR